MAVMKKKSIIIFYLLTSALSLTLSGGAFGQEAEPAALPGSDIDLAKRKSLVIVRKRAEEAESKGIELGSFLFTPAIAFTEYYDDNIFATETNQQDDFITVITPSFNLKSRWAMHRLEMAAGLEVSRYADLANENTNNYWANVSGQYDFSRQQNVFGGFAYTRDHEDRASPDTEAGDKPTKFDDYLAHLGYAFKTNNHHGRIVYTANQLDYQNVTSSGSVIDNSDRDRTEQALGLRYLYKYSPVTAWFVEGVADRRDYDRTPDFSGNDRNSDGYRYSAGVEYLGPASVTKMFIGALGRNYQSASFEDQTEVDFGLNYAWKFYPAGKLVLKGGRAIEETTFNNSSGYLLTDLSAGVFIEVVPGKTVSFEAMASSADYYEIDRQDDYYDYTLGYTQKIIKNLSLGLDLHRGERDSNVAGEDYTINQVYVRISGVI